MRKMKNIIIFTLFVIMLIISLAALNISIGFECSEKDSLLYRIGGFVLTLSYAIGFLIEFIISRFTNGIKNNPVKKRVILWSSIVVFSIVAFVACYGFTSNDFKNDMQMYNINLDRPSKTERNINETTENIEPSKIKEKKKVTENEQNTESKKQETADSDQSSDSPAHSRGSAAVGTVPRNHRHSLWLHRPGRRFCRYPLHSAWPAADDAGRPLAVCFLHRPG